VLRRGSSSTARAVRRVVRGALLLFLYLLTRRTAGDTPALPWSEPHLVLFGFCAASGKGLRPMAVFVYVTNGRRHAGPPVAGFHFVRLGFCAANGKGLRPMAVFVYVTNGRRHAGPPAVRTSSCPIGFLCRERKGPTADGRIRVHDERPATRRPSRGPNFILSDWVFVPRAERACGRWLYSCT
jgi:hypothetical protein